MTKSGKMLLLIGATSDIGRATAMRFADAGYPGLDRFRKVRRDVGAAGRISSRLSARLGI